MDPNSPSLDQPELASNIMTLCNHLTLVNSSRFRSSTLLPKVKRRIKISGKFESY